MKGSQGEASVSQEVMRQLAHTKVQYEGECRNMSIEVTGACDLCLGRRT